MDNDAAKTGDARARAARLKQPAYRLVRKPSSCASQGWLRIEADLALGRHDELVGEIEALVTEYALDSYNRFRPHRALDGLTPLHRVNNLSGTNT